VNANAPFLGGHESLGELGGGDVVHRQVDLLPGFSDGAEQVPADAAVRREVNLGRGGRAGQNHGEARQEGRCDEQVPAVHTHLP